MPVSIKSFSGLNHYSAKGDLKPTELTVADNVDLSAGEIRTRPGVQAQLTTPLSAPFYGPVPYLKSDGSTTVLLSGNSKLYSWVKYANTVSEVLNSVGSVSFSINSQAFQGCRLGNYAYFVDGSNNYPIRTNLATNTAQYVSGLNPPTTAPTASLSSQVIDGLTTTTGFQVDTIAAVSNVLASAGDFSLFNTSTEYSPSSNIVMTCTDLVIGAANTVSSVLHPFTAALTTLTLVITAGTGFTPGSYTINSVTAAGVATLNSSPGTNGSTGGSGHVNNVWVVTGPDLDFNASGAGLNPLPAGYTGNYAMVDDPGEGLTSTLVPNVLISNTLNETRHCTQFQFSMATYTADTTSKQAITITLTAYSDAGGTTVAGTAQRTYAQNYNTQNPNSFWQDIIDFPGLAEDILSYRVSIVGASTNVRNHGPMFSAPSVMPIGNQFTLIPGATSGITVNNNYAAAGNGPANNGRFGGARITNAYTTDQNWSSFTVISLSLSTLGGLPLSTLVADGLSIVFGFRQYNAGSPGQPHYYSNPVQFSSSSGVAFVDISNMPSNILAAFRYFEIFFTADLATAPTAFTPLFEINSISNGGNLSSSQIAGGITTAPYFYIVTEVNDTDNAAFAPQLVNIIESDPGPISNQITPNGFADIGSVVVPAATNGATTTWFSVYRGGGIYGTALNGALLIATVPVGSDVALGGDALNRDNSNPYISWNHTTRTLTDNTPDGFLFNAQILQYGREQLPKGAQAICAWQNRVWFGAGSTLYGSWNVVANAESGAYTTTIDVANDPQASIKGITLGVGAADNDTIVALVPIGSYLFILKNYSVWILSGYDPTSFALQQFLQYAGSGSVAPRAAVVSASDGPAYTPFGISFNHAVFLGSDGLYSFDGAVSKPASVPLYTVLNVKDRQGNILIPASVYSKIAVMFHNHRLLIFAPEVYYYKDLVIDATTNTKVTSAKRPFTSADIGASLNITGGTGFTVPNQNGAIPTITAVVAGVATLSSPAGTVSSTGGEANFAAGKNTITWVFDTLVGGFTRYLVGGTSGCSLSAGTDTNDAIICGNDGQIYLLAGVGDKATPTSSLAAIPISVTTGGIGQGFGQGAGDQGYYAKSRPTRMWIDVVSPNPAPTYTLVVSGDAGKTCVKTYTPASGEDSWTSKITPSTQGLTVTLGISASAVGRIVIRGVGLDFAKGSIQGY